ncbi:MAG: hypothetical protein ACTSR8_13970 [Promethearchaeota archaeon]
MLWNIVVLIILSNIISVIGIIYISTHKQEYGTFIIPLLIIGIYIFDQSLYFTTFCLATQDIIKDIEIILSLFKIALIFRLISLVLLSTINTFALDYGKRNYIIILYYGFLAGIIISLLFEKNALNVDFYQDHYFFTFNNSYLEILIVIYNISVVLFAIIILFQNHKQIRDKKLARLFSIIILHFTFIIFTYVYYLINRNLIFLYIHLYSYIIGAISILFITIKFPALFILLKNKIYNLIIFHRSGILLYSYDFLTGKETDDSIMKGMILIGINHILANFIDKKDQLNIIKLKEQDIILDINNEYGFALLLIANKLNQVISKSVDLFMENFSEINKEHLRKVNNYSLIDVTVFRNTRKLIQEYFPIYIKNNKI